MIRKCGLALMAALVLLVAIASPSGAAEIEASAPVVKVTVYRGRALVERVGVVDLPAGDHDIMVKGLPSSLDRRSLKFSGKGPGGVEIAGVEVRKAFLSEPEHPDITRLTAELKEFHRAEREDRESLKGIESSEKFLDSISAEFSRQTADETRTGALNIKKVKSLQDYLTRERITLAKKRLRINERIKERKGEVEALKKRLKELRSVAGAENTEVVVNVSCSRTGGLSFTLAYLVPGANWRPAYIVRKEGDGVTLDYFGEVNQATGEDWRAVEMSLSTARPALGAKPPKLPPWTLDVLEPRPRKGFAEAEVKRRVMAPTATGALAEPETAEERPSAPIYTGTTALFRVPGRHDLPSKKGFNRFLITRLVLPAKLAYIIRPEMRPFAYLVAQVVNSSAYPILPGQIQAFVGPDFVGRAWLKAAPRGSEFNVGFGVDESVKVTREVKNFKELKLFGGRVTRSSAVEIEVENHKDASLDAEIEERLPVSRDRRIEVEIAETTPEAEIDLEKGRLTWKRTIGPSAKDRMDYKLLITHPTGVPISGI